MNPCELVCLFTASDASKDVRDDLVHAQTKEVDVYRSFGKSRTNAEESALIFQDRILKQRIKTFSDMQMYSRMKATQREVLIKADHYIKQIIIKTSIWIPPCYIADCNGTMREPTNLL